ncbi:MAG: PKD domain-containing protein, partial [Bacteroidota bacterium]
CPECSTEWHKGVDLSPEGGDADIGDHLLAIEAGDVHFIRGDTDYKHMTISSTNNYNYAHIFRNGVNVNSMRTGDLILKKMNNPYHNHYAIIYAPANGTPTAIGQHDGQVSFDHPLLPNNLIDVETDVELDDVVAPLGDAAGGDAHLHLHRLRTAAGGLTRPNATDPLEEIDHDEPEYDVTIPAANMNIVYGDDESSIMVRGAIRGEDRDDTYDDGVMNADIVRLEIKKEYEAESEFDMIQGPYFESRIGLGGRTTPSTTIYPAAISGRDGSVDATGINPFAYTVPNAANPQDGMPYDDYYFSDFNTRIHTNDVRGGTKTIAYINEDARYPDGRYDLRATLTTVRDVVHPLPTNRTSNAGEVILDNYLPYIKDVVVRAGDENGRLIYRGQWNWDGSALTFNANHVSKVSSTETIWVKAIASEQLACLISQVDYFGAISDICQPGGESGEEWIFTFNEIPLNRVNTLSFEGQDLAGNFLNIEPYHIPTRTSNNSWSASHNLDTDTHHQFWSGDGCFVNNGGVAPNALKSNTLEETNGCIYAGIDLESNSIVKGEPVEFSAFAFDTNWDYDWDFDDGTAQATDVPGPITVVFNNTGQKTITLTICEDPNNTSTCAQSTETIFVSKDGVSAFDVNFNVPHWSLHEGEEVTLLAPQVSGHTGTLSYYWNFGEGLGYVDDPTSPTPTVSYSSPGQKNVSLTVTDDFQSVTVTKNSAFNVSQSGWGFDVSINSFSCSVPNTSYPFQFSASLFGDDPFGTYTFYWDFGDGDTYTTSNRNQVVNHYYDHPGKYDVYLKVCDGNGICAGDIIEECVEVEPPMGNEFDLVASLYANGDVLQDLSILESLPFYLVEVYENEPISLVTETRGGEGDPNNFRYRYWLFGGKFVENDSDYIEIAPGDGPVSLEVYFPNAFFDSGDISDLPYMRVQVFDENDSYACTGCNYYSEKKYIKVLNQNYSGDKCFVDLSDGVLTDYCYDPAGNFPELTIPVGDTRCTGDVRIEVEQLVTNQFGLEYSVLVTNDLQPGNVFDFSWLQVADRPTEFPYTGTFIARAYLENQGSSVLAGGRQFTVNLSGPIAVDAGPDISLCYGASAVLGGESQEGYAYEWSSSDDVSLVYLNKSDVSNPTFTAITDASAGTYTYTMTVTDLASGCSNSDEVTVSASGITTTNQSHSVVAGTSKVLTAGVSGGGDDYDYLWSPSTYLDDPSKASPIFSAPNSATTINYSVNVSYRDGSCSATSSVTVNVFDLPPTDLVVKIDPFGHPDLSWTDNSIEAYFEILRSADGGVTWETIGNSEMDDSAFVNFQCLEQNREYCFKVVAWDIAGNRIGETAPACDTTPFLPYEEITNYSYNWTGNWAGNGIVHNKNNFFGAGGSGSVVNRFGNVTSVVPLQYERFPLTNTDAAGIIEWDDNYNFSKKYRTQESDYDFYPTSVSYQAFYNPEIDEVQDYYFAAGINYRGELMLTVGAEGYDRYYKWSDHGYPKREHINLSFPSLGQTFHPNAPVFSDYFETNGTGKFVYATSTESSNTNNGSDIQSRLLIQACQVSITNINNTLYRTFLHHASDKVQISGSSPIYLKDFKVDHRNYGWAVSEHGGNLRIDYINMNTMSVVGTFQTAFIGLQNAEIGFAENEAYVIAQSNSTSKLFLYSILHRSLIDQTNIKNVNGEILKSINTLNNYSITVEQDNTDILISSVDSDGDILFDSRFNASDMDFLIGSTVRKQHLIVDYLDGGEHVKSRVFGQGFMGDKDLAICQSDIADQNETFYAKTIRASDGCTLTLNSGDNLKLYAKESVVLKSGFYAKVGSELTIRPAISQECEDGVTARVTQNQYLSLEEVPFEETDFRNDFLVTLYPNPSNHFIRIQKLMETESAVNIRVTNLKGELIDEISLSRMVNLDERIPVTNYNEGVYFVIIQTNKETVTKKVIIRK